MAGILCGEVGVAKSATAGLIRAVEHVTDAPGVAGVVAAVGAAIGSIK